MSSVGKYGLEEPNLDKARELETEKIVNNLIKAGLLDVSIDNDEIIQLSDQAVTMGHRIQRRFLEKLNIDTMGKYIKEIRKAKALDEGEVAKHIKITRETFSQLERNQMKFNDLSPQKAASLFKFLDLNFQIIVDFLRSPLNISSNLSAHNSFYRTKSPLTQEDKFSLYSPASNASDQQIVEKFIEDFQEELKKSR